MYTVTAKHAKTTIFSLLTVTLLRSLGSMHGVDATKNSEQLRLEEKGSAIEKNEEAFQKLAQMAFMLEDEIAHREHLIRSDSASEPEKIAGVARMSQLQGELVPIYKEMERTQASTQKKETVALQCMPALEPADAIWPVGGCGI